MIEKMHEAESYERKNKGGHTMNRFKCPLAGVISTHQRTRQKDVYVADTRN